jgi:hypothetical protein
MRLSVGMLLGRNHIFDTHVMEREQWTYEQLVDYVRSIEPAEETSAPESVPGDEQEEIPEDLGGYRDPAEDRRFA